MANPPPPRMPPPPPQPVPKWRYTCVRVARWALAVLFICVCIQVSLAAFGIFGRPEDFIPLHKQFVHVFEFLPVLMLLGLFGRDWALGTVGFVLFFLIGTQYGLIGSELGMVQALHVVNAFLIFGTTLVLLTRRWPWAPIAIKPKPAKPAQAVKA